jgi:hypothetical protein
MSAHLFRPDTMNLRQLMFTHDDETCVVVSTGPSLDEDVKAMKAADRSAFKVIATTSALNPLLANGITPDYAAIDDGAHWISELHYKGLETAHPRTSEDWPGPRYYYHDFCPSENFLSTEGLPMEVFPQFPAIPVSGCTTNVAIQIALFLGFKRAVLVGTDLSFPGERSHCTKYERDMEPSEESLERAKALVREQTEACHVESLGAWKPKPINEEFYRKKAGWIAHMCPKGCAYAIQEWKPGQPLDNGPTKCAGPGCNEEMRHIPTSAEYMFYVNCLFELVQNRLRIKVDGNEEDRQMQVINATSDGIVTMLRCAPFAEAIGDGNGG